MAMLSVFRSGRAHRQVAGRTLRRTLVLSRLTSPSWYPSALPACAIAQYSCVSPLRPRSTHSTSSNTELRRLPTRSNGSILTTPFSSPHLPLLAVTSRQIARTYGSASSTRSEKQTNPCSGESFTLADDRTLGFHLYGAPDGIPVIYIHGVLDSGITLQGKEDDLAKDLNIRWIAPDRPGIGKSTFQPRRTVLGYADDIRQLVDHLGLTQYYLLGVSGGSAYALACAKMLPREHVRGVGICAGVAPWSAGRRGQSLRIISQMYMMKYWPRRMLRHMNDVYVPLARDPDPAPMANHFREDLLRYVDAEEADAYMQTDAMQSAVRVHRQYYAQGIEGHVEDMRILTRSWGFRVEDVGVEGVRLWYGGADINTPPRMGLYLAHRLPKSVYKEYASETHASLLGGGYLREILSELIATPS